MLDLLVRPAAHSSPRLSTQSRSHILHPPNRLSAGTLSVRASGLVSASHRSGLPTSAPHRLASLLLASRLRHRSSFITIRPGPNLPRLSIVTREKSSRSIAGLMSSQRALSSPAGTASSKTVGRESTDLHEEQTPLSSAAAAAQSVESSAGVSPAAVSSSSSSATASAQASQTQTQTQPSNQQPLLIDDIPAQNVSSASTVLDVGTGEAVKLDHLGPMVVNVDGTLSRINNWPEMSTLEQKNTLRILGKRNKARLEALRSRKGSGDGGA